MNPIISIDLGATYTKLALRRRPTSQTELLAHEMLLLDEQHICIPTVAAWHESTQRWSFGVDAVDLQSGNGIQVYRNWKPFLFQHEDGPDPSVALRLAPGAPSIEEMAREYFRWILQTFLPETLGLPVESNVLARICVPDFALNTPAIQVLESILHQAGWHTETPFAVSEPLANLTGAMTQGQNRIDLDDDGIQRPVLADMFAETEFINFMRSSSAQAQPYKVLVVDIGAYTADFGLVGMTPDCSDFFPHCVTRSLPLGILTLDDRVCMDLPDDKREALKELSPTDRERFRQVVYSMGMPWRLTPDLIIGMDAEAKIVGHCMFSLAEDIADSLDQFLADHRQEQIQEVVLSGGGNSIPRIATYLTQRLAQRQVLGFHLSLPEHLPGEAHTFPLSQQVVRGASAIGGASVLFDPVPAMAMA